MDYDYAKYLRALLETCLAIGLKEQADRIRKLIAETKATIAKRKELEKQVDTMSPIMKKYIEKVNNSLECHTKLMNTLSKLKDTELSVLLMNTFNEYVEARNNEHMELLMLVELRRMDDLEHLVSQHKGCE
jgi:DNA repair ATPase RecN